MAKPTLIARYPTGSHYICDPPVTDTDRDYVCLVKDGYEEDFEADGFEAQSSDEEYQSQGVFKSWRKGNLNYIATKDKDFLNKFVAATALAKQLNLLDKDMRINLFETILYGGFFDLKYSSIGQP